MFKSNNVFDKNTSSKSLKYFLIAFALFILILSIVSVVMFMKSIDFDMNNLTGKTTTQPVESTEDSEPNDILLSDLTGESKILFACENSGDLDFVCLIEVSFSQGYIKVSSVDGDEAVEKDKTLAQTYNENDIDGVKDVLYKGTGILVDKYIVCNRKQFKDMLSLFDDVSINVESAVDYHSYDFNLELDAGNQILSEDYLVKYLIISDNSTRSKVFCNVLNSVLIPRYTENSEKLFTQFVNSCKTDISIIDYSESIDELIVYSKTEDRFLATVK